MGNHPYFKSICIILLFFFVAACSPIAAKEPLPTDTPVPLPTDTPGPTLTPTKSYEEVGEWWFVWIRENRFHVHVNFIVDGSQISGTIEEDNLTTEFTAIMSYDGVSADGEWDDSDGRSGQVSLLFSEDKHDFSGNLDGSELFCGSRAKLKKPNPCHTQIGFDWGGEWIAWLGPEQTEVVLFFEQEAGEVNTLIYDFKGTIDEDGRTLTGTFNEFGFQGELEAKILDNKAQFNGNMSGILPFCGVRRGGPKPVECFGP